MHTVLNPLIKSTVPCFKTTCQLPQHKRINKPLQTTPDTLPSFSSSLCGIYDNSTTSTKKAVAKLNLWMFWRCYKTTTGKSSWKLINLPSRQGLKNVQRIWHERFHFTWWKWRETSKNYTLIKDILVLNEAGVLWKKPLCKGNLKTGSYHKQHEIL